MKILSAIVTLAAIQSLSAGVVTFVADPTANSVDFATAVAMNGGTITTLTFDDQATGALNPDAYSGLGVTLTGVNFTTIVNGAGPGQGNTGGASPGEGVHPVSNFLSEGSSNDGSLTVSFASPVLAAGLFTIDLFNPDGTSDPVSLSAFTGPNGTGTLLGTAADVAANFQQNNLYFLGILSTAGDIGSVVFTQDGDSSGDVIGLDNVEFAGGTTSTPEPGTLSLIGIGLVGAALARKRLRS